MQGHRLALQAARQLLACHLIAIVKPWTCRAAGRKDCCSAFEELAHPIQKTAVAQSSSYQAGKAVLPWPHLLQGFGGRWRNANQRCHLHKGAAPLCCQHPVKLSSQRHPIAHLCDAGQGSLPAGPQYQHLQAGQGCTSVKGCMNETSLAARCSCSKQQARSGLPNRSGMPQPWYSQAMSTQTYQHERQAVCSCSPGSC